MERVELVPAVLDDLDRIVAHLRQHEVADADARVEQIIGALDVLEGNPLIGRPAGDDRRELLIGRDAPLIETALADSGVPLHHAPSLPEAVTLAADLAQPGDAVLLSPACASFDMFRDYAHRAEIFRDAVSALAQQQGTVLEGGI